MISAPEFLKTQHRVRDINTHAPTLPTVVPATEFLLDYIFPEGDYRCRDSNVLFNLTKASGKTDFYSAGLAFYMLASLAFSEVLVASPSFLHGKSRIYKALTYSIRHNSLFRGKYNIRKDGLMLENASECNVIPSGVQNLSGTNANLILWDELFQCESEEDMLMFEEALPRITDIYPTSHYRLMFSYAGIEGRCPALTKMLDLTLKDKYLIDRTYGVYHNQDAGIITAYDTGQYRLPWLTDAELAKEKMRLRDSQFRRYYLNQTTISGDSDPLMTESEFDALYDPELEIVR